MYTSIIGQRFLEIYNKNRKKKLTAKEFFEKEIFGKFYNHKKYFKWIVNSPFVQKLSKEESKGIKTFEDEQRLKLEKLHEKIDKDAPDSSFAIGFPAANEIFDTSGQVTNLKIPMDKDTIYASWIGSGFGLEVEGKQVWYINREKPLETIYSGWSEYRKHLNSKVLNLKSNEIDLWNSVWLDYKFNKDRIVKKFLLDEYIERNTETGGNVVYSLKQRSWIKTLFLLSNIFPKENVTVFSSRYVYDKQKYVTIGFVNINLPEVEKFKDFYTKIFTMNNGMRIHKIVDMYETRFSFSRASEQGAIGLKAIEPRDLRKYMPSKSGSSEIPKFKDDEKSKINYSIYITWVVAMLNNKDLLDLAEKAAQAFREYERGEKRLVKRDNEIKELLSSRNRKELIDHLTQLVEEEPKMSEVCNSLVNALMMDIAADNVPLFVTLMRFKYALPN